MKRVIIRLRLESDLGTPMRGDTLFGQLCWAIAMREGQQILSRLLAGYTSGKPFLVISDAFPCGFVPRPELPPPRIRRAASEESHIWQDRKDWSELKWLMRTTLSTPLINVFEASKYEQPKWFETHLQSHNTINRMTGTTGTGMFAPYQEDRLSIADSDGLLDLDILFDEEKFIQAQLQSYLEDIGKTGFGRDASTGLGRFSVADVVDCPAQRVSGPVIALAPCVPMLGSVDIDHSWWRPFTRFGRHGGHAAHGLPFKAPILMADTGSVWSILGPEVFVGRGLGGDGRISKSMPETVHQAYAPILAIDLEGWHV